jgi:hypothetical protein
VYPLKRFAKIGNIRHRIVIVHIPGDIMQVTEYAADKNLHIFSSINLTQPRVG